MQSFSLFVVRTPYAHLWVHSTPLNDGVSNPVLDRQIPCVYIPCALGVGTTGFKFKPLF